MRVSSFPFSIRGLVILLVGIFLLLGPAFGEHDVIATVAGGAIIATLILLGAISFFTGRKTRRTMRLIPGLPVGESGVGVQRIHAGASVLISLRVEGCHLPPLFVADIEVHFAESGLDPLLFTLTGTHSSSELLFHPTTFPHRGNWRVSRAVFAIRDQIGLTRSVLSLSEQHVSFSVPVMPKVEVERALPILSSSHRAGDVSLDVQHRQGDPFDIKRYHPSDGMKKLLWKVYARRRELLSRHPETSMTPEGQVALFLVAERRDEAAASLACSYAKRLEELHLEIFFGCEGMGARPLAHSAGDIERLVVNSVWETPEAEEDLAITLERCIDETMSRIGDAKLASLIIIADELRASTMEGAALLDSVGDLLAERGVTPVFFLAPTVRSRTDVPTRGIIRRFFLGTPAAHHRPVDASAYAAFMQACLTHQREVVVPR